MGKGNDQRKQSEKELDHAKKLHAYREHCACSEWEGPAPRAIVAFKRKMAH